MLLLIKPEDEFRLGNTSFSNILNNDEYNNLKNKCNFDIPDFKNLNKFRNIFNMIQLFIKNNYILSGHDVSDGGLITTLCEMSIASNIGINITIKNKHNVYEFLFNEELGLVLEISFEDYSNVIKHLKIENINYIYLGETVNNDCIRIEYIDTNQLNEIFNEKIKTVRSKWQETSYKLEEKQCLKQCVIKEKEIMYNPNIIEFNIPEKIYRNICNFNNFEILKPKVAILREEGSNGDREMIYCFHLAGFDVYDIKGDIENDIINLDNFKGIVFVGGFSFSDVKVQHGWYSSIINNPKIKYYFDKFYNRKDTFRRCL